MISACQHKTSTKTRIKRVLHTLRVLPRTVKLICILGLRSVYGLHPLKVLFAFCVSTASSVTAQSIWRTLGLLQPLVK